MKKLFLFLFLFLLVSSCEKDEILDTTSFSEEQEINTRAKKNKVQICHRLGNGNYKKIKINQNAEAAHFQHGDVLPGNCLDSGYYITEDCEVIDVSTLEDVCDGIDNNCNGETDEGAIEICNNLDDDCDGEIDEGLGTLYFLDLDDDGYGDSENSLLACNKPAGYVINSSDCNDSYRAINPSMQEICDDVDNNCDGILMECPPCEEYTECIICPYIQPVDNIIYACSSINAAMGEVEIGYEDGTSIYAQYGHFLIILPDGSFSDHSVSVNLNNGTSPIFTNSFSPSTVVNCILLLDNLAYQFEGHEPCP